MSKPTMLLFDGDCGPCDRGMRRLRNGARPAVEVKPFQSVDVDELDVPSAVFSQGPVLVRPDGSFTVGPAAIAEVLSTARAPYRLVGRLMSAPGARHVLARVGPVMYRQRHRLPGADASCEVPAA